VRCVNENRKQRKRLIGCFDDWLFRSTIPIGWRFRALSLNGNQFYAMFFACVILLRLLRTFLTQSIALRRRAGTIFQQGVKVKNRLFDISDVSIFLTPIPNFKGVS